MLNKLQYQHTRPKVQPSIYSSVAIQKILPPVLQPAFLAGTLGTQVNF